MNDARCFSWIIHRDHGVIVAAVLLGEGGGGDVRVERSDVPRTNSEDVGHGSSRQWRHGLDGQLGPWHPPQPSSATAASGHNILLPSNIHSGIIVNPEIALLKRR